MFKNDNTKPFTNKNTGKPVVQIGKKGKQGNSRAPGTTWQFFHPIKVNTSIFRSLHANLLAISVFDTLCNTILSCHSIVSNNIQHYSLFVLRIYRTVVTLKKIHISLTMSSAKPTVFWLSKIRNCSHCQLPTFDQAKSNFQNYQHKNPLTSLPTDAFNE